MSGEHRYRARHLAEPEKSAPARRRPAAASPKRRPAPVRLESGGKRGGKPDRKAEASGRKGSGSALLYEKSLLPMVEHVHRIDQASLRVGVIWLLILPVLLLVIRKLTGSSKLTFLIIWIVLMFIISAALILIAYADHELKRFLESAREYEPAAYAKLDELFSRRESIVDLRRLGVPSDALRRLIERRRARTAAGVEDALSFDDAEELNRLEDWLNKVEMETGKEGEHAEHPTDHTH